MHCSVSHVTVTGMLVCSTADSAVKAANLSPRYRPSHRIYLHISTLQHHTVHISLVSSAPHYLCSHRDSLILQRTHNWPLCPHYMAGADHLSMYISDHFIFSLVISALTCDWVRVSAQVISCPGTPRSWPP